MRGNMGKFAKRKIVKKQCSNCQYAEYNPYTQYYKCVHEEEPNIYGGRYLYIGNKICKNWWPYDRIKANPLELILLLTEDMQM